MCFSRPLARLMSNYCREEKLGSLTEAQAGLPAHTMCALFAFMTGQQTMGVLHWTCTSLLT